MPQRVPKTMLAQRNELRTVSDVGRERHVGLLIKQQCAREHDLLE
jgi:hypothetical protein